MRHRGRIEVVEGSKQHPSSRPLKKTVCVMKGLTATTKTTRVRYRKVKGKWTPIAVDGIALNIKDQSSDGTEAGSLQDLQQDFPDIAFDYEPHIEQHIFQMEQNGIELDDGYEFEVDEDGNYY